MKNMILHIALTTLLASMTACSDETVSYTHLDVYKRQVPLHAEILEW